MSIFRSDGNVGAPGGLIFAAFGVLRTAPPCMVSEFLLDLPHVDYFQSWLGNERPLFFGRFARMTRCPVFLIFLFLAATLGGLQGTSVRPIPWQEQIVKAHMVGVVECTQAGGIVAHYTVVDSWKGPFAKGDPVKICIPPDVWGPQFPSVLIGQRYLVAARQSEGRSANSRGLVPL